MQIQLIPGCVLARVKTSFPSVGKPVGETFCGGLPLPHMRTNQPLFCGVFGDAAAEDHAEDKDFYARIRYVCS